MMRKVYESALTIPLILAVHRDLRTRHDRHALSQAHVIDDQNSHSILTAQDESLVLQVPVRVAQDTPDSAGQSEPRARTMLMEQSGS
jgi:hypothetical protein